MRLGAKSPSPVDEREMSDEQQRDLIVSGAHTIYTLHASHTERGDAHSICLHTLKGTIMQWFI